MPTRRPDDVWLIRGALGVFILALGGCNGTQADPHITQIQELEDKVQGQNRVIQAQKSQIAEQQREIQTLQGLGDEARLARLIHVDRISLEGMSGGYDDDRDSVDEGAVAYLRLMDKDGDVIKAAGSAVLEAYDLAAPESERLVASAEFNPDEMAAAWFGRFLTSHYTLRAPWKSGKLPAHKTLTIVVRFTELLTGKSFEVQHTAEIHGPAL